MANENELQVKVTVQGDTAGAQEVESAIKGIKQEAGGLSATTKEGLQDQAKIALAYQVSGKAAGEAAEKVKGLGLASYGLREIIGGIQFGRPAEAIRGLINVTRGLGGAFIGTTALIAGPFIAALGAMRLKIAENETTMKRWYTEHEANTKKYLTLLEEMKKASAVALKEMTAEVDQLAKSYEGVVHAIDAAANRVKTLGAARDELAKATLDTEEKQALAKAPTAAAREQITAEYARKREALETKQKLSGFDTAELDAQVRTKAAQEQITKADQQRREAEARVQQAQQVFDEKSRNALNYGKSTAPNAEAARKEALAAREALQEAQQNAVTIGGKTGAEIEKAQETIDAAKLEIEETQLRRAAYQKILEGKLAEAQTPKAEGAVKQLAGSQQSAKDIQAQIYAAKEADFKSSTLGQHTDTSKLEAELAKARRAEADAYQMIAKDGAERAKSANNIKQQIKNSRESSGT